MSKKESKKSRRCMVCGKEVPAREWFSINAGVTGNLMALWGHSTCVNNVDKLVVLPNRKDFREMIHLISCFTGGPRILKKIKRTYESSGPKGCLASIGRPGGKSVVPEKHLPGGPSSARLRTTVAE